MRRAADIHRPAGLPETQRRLRSDPEFDAGFALLFDVREADLTRLDVATLRHAAQNTPFGATAPRAYLTNDLATFGLMRMLQTYSELRKLGGPLMVFRDRNAAMEWLHSVARGRPQLDPDAATTA